MNPKYCIKMYLFFLKFHCIADDFHNNTFFDKRWKSLTKLHLMNKSSAVRVSVLIHEISNCIFYAAMLLLRRVNFHGVINRRNIPQLSWLLLLFKLQTKNKLRDVNKSHVGYAVISNQIVAQYLFVNKV